MPNRLKGRDIHESHRAATPLELLFDLTFVVAIALAASQLHHGLAEHHFAQAGLAFTGAFFAIWWAWMNYTWFASAYDADDVPHRLLTMLQMAGVLIFAVGVPGFFTGDFRAAVVGFAIMRIAQTLHWLRVAHGDPGRRRTALRYVSGILVLQCFWGAWLWVPPEWAWPMFAGLALAEVMVPAWAERGGATPWHAHHIAERYGLLVIITLGEIVLASANAIANLWRADGWSFDLALVGIGAMMLVLSLWWMYFLLPSAEALHRHRERGFAWGYGHLVVLLSLAAMGAGLEVVADTLNPGVVTPGDAARPLQAISMVAIPEAAFVVSLWLVHQRLVRPPRPYLGMIMVCLVAIAAVPLAVAMGLRLPWALLALSAGPIAAIWLYTHGDEPPVGISFAN
ncbi:low temperature requirement protein A [Novilysobacter erysipheiresistens]|uniref:Low temperature requirement protein A n=1 Tax=Novilysobacter erysipheiresistens TaxID=1749332 RepID=A0ABU7YXT0_9GAMM